MNILAIDFGLKHLGLAISEGNLAEPYRELTFPKMPKDTSEVKDLKHLRGGGNKLISQISLICQKEKIDKIILGLPEGKLAEVIKDFGRELEKQTHLPVIFQDETLTSQEATQKMIEAGLPLKKRQQSNHLFSACLILQDYLDSF